ncbi:MAG: carbohydrate kinase family protein [Pseudomonadota bacterium]
MVEAVTFGSAMVDIIAVLQSDSIEQISLSNAHQQFLLVEPGRKVEASSISTHIGGGGLNTAVCLARLGCSVSPVVKTGTDPSRDHVIDHCEKHGLLKTRLLTDEIHNTGSAVMIASHDKNAAIFTQRGANTTLVASDVDEVSPLDAGLVHIAPLSGDSADMLPIISELAKQKGAFVSCNPGIRQITTRTNTVLTAAKNLDLISINGAEAAALIPCLSALNADLIWAKPNENEPILRSQESILKLEQFCEALHAHGPDNVLVTYGGGGAYLFDGKKLHHQPIVSAEVAGTAGAGDAFVSTLAWSLHSGFTSENALLMAAHNASSVVSFVNTTDGLLERDELERRAGL